MKKILILCVGIIIAYTTQAQESDPTLYLIFEFMHVPDEQGGNYTEVEEFWSKLHKQRVEAGKIIGWDLWSLTPSGSEQGSQYMTVTLFSSLKDMMTPLTWSDMEGYMKNAYPDLSEEDMQAMSAKTTASRDIAHQVYLKQISATEDDYQMPVGTMATIDIMKQLNGNYEKAEDKVFKPFHQQMVDDGKKASWGLLKTLLPTGSEAYASHITVNMYTDVAQLTAAMEGGPGDMDEMTQLAVQEGLQSRDMLEVKIGTLVMKVR